MTAQPTRERLELAINWLAIVLMFVLPLFRRGVTITSTLIILLWLFSGRWADKVRALRRVQPIFALALFVAVNIVSLLWSADLSEAIAYIFKYRYFLITIALATTLKPVFRERAIFAFLLGHGISLVGSYSLALGLVSFGRGSVENPSPTMLHLDYSVFLALVPLMVLNRMIHRDMSWTHRSGWAIFLGVSIGGLFINIGRSGQLAFAGTALVLVILLLYSRSWLLAIASLAGVIALLFVMYLVVPTFHSRFDEGVREISGALNSQEFNTNQGKRIAAASISAQIVKRSPVVGVGVGDAMNEFRHEIDESRPDLREAIYWFPHLHNQYIEVAVQLGLVGLIALINIFVQLFRVRFADRETGRLAIILGCVYLIAFVGDPFLHKQLPLVLFSTLCGVILAEKGNPE